MNSPKKTVTAILLATLWISLSEFIRNEWLFKSYWTDHYQSLGLIFPSDPVNGAIWGLWSLLFATAIIILSKRYTVLQTTFLSWFIVFVMMWVVVGNMGVLPFGILIYAIPLSLLETFVAVYIIDKFRK